MYQSLQTPPTHQPASHRRFSSSADPVINQQSTTTAHTQAHLHSHLRKVKPDEDELRLC